MSELECPVCRAGNAAGPHCRRCRADLALLFTIEAQRRAALAAARHAIRREDWVAAERQLHTAASLRNGADVAQLQAACHLLQGDFADAWSRIADWRLAIAD